MGLYSERIYKCPYCLHEFKQEDIEKDDVKETNNGKIIFCPNKEIGRNGRPICHRRLPSDFFKSETKVITIIGGPGTGKTYFFMALQRILQDSSIQDLGISGTLYFPDKDSEEHFSSLSNNVRDRIKIEPTKPDADEERNAFCLQINNDRRLFPKTIYISFFDNPGEIFVDEGSMMNNMNLCNSDAVFFLVAPEQIKPLINHIAKDTKSTKGEEDDVEIRKNRPKEKTNLETIIGNERPGAESTQPFLNIINNIIRIYDAKNNNRVIDTPFAICLSKFDLVEESLTEKQSFGLPYPIPHDINYSDDSNNKEFEEFLTQYDFIDRLAIKVYNIFYNKNYDCTNLFKKIKINSQYLHYFFQKINFSQIKNRIQNHFSNYSLFVIQSINQKWELEPRGISLPLLWILKQLKLY